MFFKLDGFKNDLFRHDENTIIIECYSRNRNHGYAVTIDAHQLERIVEVGSSVHVANKSGRYPYAWIMLRNGKGEKILLQNFITNCPKGKVADHLDFDTLNCRESNLKVVPFGTNTSRKKSKVVREQMKMR